MTRSELDAVVQGVAGAVREQLAGLVGRVDALEAATGDVPAGAGRGETGGGLAAAVAALAARLDRVELTVPRYVGVWRDDTPYRLNDLVTWGGSMWIAIHGSTNMKPGSGADAASSWKLCVKAGRNGPAGKPGRDGCVHA